MATALRKGMPGWDRLFAMWIGEGKPGYVLSGEEQFQVATPDGDESPAFIATSHESSYSSVSIAPAKPAAKSAAKAKGGKK